VSDESQHIEQRLRVLLSDNDSKVEFLVPEQYFELLDAELRVKLTSGVASDEELIVPDAYFEQMGEQVLSIVAPMDNDVPDAFFEEQQSLILAQAKLKEITDSGEEWLVPNNYFEQQEKQILQETSIDKGKVVSMKPWFWRVTSAAAIVGFAWLMFWPKEQALKPTFAQVSSIVPIDEDDMEYFASEEDYYDLYLTEMEDWAQDTIVSDTISVDQLPNENVNQPAPSEPMKLDPKTGLPLKKGSTAEGANSEKKISWDDISEDELMKYLMDEGEEDLLNDLN
jgi:hypothetical protein